MSEGYSKFGSFTGHSKVFDGGVGKLGRLHEHGTQIIRHVSAADIERNYGVTLQQYYDHVEKVFSTLDRFGIVHDSHIGVDTLEMNGGSTHAFTRQYRNKAAPVLRVMNSKLVPLQIVDREQRAYAAQRAVHLIENLYRYGDNTEDSHPPELMFDIARADQYLFARVHSNAPADFVLIDTDPFLARGSEDILFYYESLLAHITQVQSSYELDESQYALLEGVKKSTIGKVQKWRKAQDETSARSGVLRIK